VLLLSFSVCLVSIVLRWTRTIDIVCFTLMTITVTPVFFVLFLQKKTWQVYKVTSLDACGNGCVVNHIIQHDLPQAGFTAKNSIDSSQWWPENNLFLNVGWLTRNSPKADVEGSQSFRIGDALLSNLGPEIGFPGWGSSWISLITPGKCCNFFFFFIRGATGSDEPWPAEQPPLQ
jgi:hypothetical protein